MSEQAIAPKIALEDFFNALVSSTQSKSGLHLGWPGTGPVTLGLVLNPLDWMHGRSSPQRSANNEFSQLVATVSGPIYRAVMTELLERRKLGAADRKTTALDAVKRLVANGSITQAEADAIERIYGLSEDQTKTDVEVAREVETIARAAQSPSTTALAIFNVLVENLAIAARGGRYQGSSKSLERSWLSDIIGCALVGAAIGGPAGAVIGAAVGIMLM